MARVMTVFQTRFDKKGRRSVRTQMTKIPSIDGHQLAMAETSQTNRCSGQNIIENNTHFVEVPTLSSMNDTASGTDQNIPSASEFVVGA
jgi:hypothetical protein